MLSSVMGEKKWITTAWNLMKDLLRSHFGHNVLKLLLELLRNGASCPKKQVLVGAVYCIHTALWSRQVKDAALFLG
ncbi:unnamed protein product [Gongylonema pulchrum]|uniref:DUF3384 domain-containing protein n=1 Tax=Gongylonema pulchrum TaxID=637853 RepID=A0A183DFJ4_9BILA|nr:unnamed protein product [Gongylonema pulchrum]